MGGKKRSKFDRIYSESEHESSEEESTIEEQDSPQNVVGNETEQSNQNNSNSLRLTTAAKPPGSPGNLKDNKFLVTRSKRKYSKREIKTASNDGKKNFCSK